MACKRIGLMHYLILLCGVLAISALPAAAQVSQKTTTRTTTSTTTTDLAPTSTRNVEYGREIEFEGRVSRVDGDVIGVVDSSGAETAVLMDPSTKIKAEGKHHSSGAAGGQSALLVGMPVKVEGHGNCAGQLVAESIKYRCCDPCGCGHVAGTY